MTIQPYLFFDGQCEEAINFYKKALGAEVTMLMRFKESPQSPPGGFPPGSDNKIMHSALKIGDAVILASDGMAQGGKPNFHGISLSLSAESDAEAEKLFNALAKDGKVQMPLGKTFFASSFGMVADRFGVGWMIIHAPMGA